MPIIREIAHGSRGLDEVVGIISRGTGRCVFRTVGKRRAMKENERSGMAGIYSCGSGSRNECQRFLRERGVGGC